MVKFVVYGKVDLMIDCVMAQPESKKAKAINTCNGFLGIIKRVL
jgi:hypothetical protein